jgi:hypothetical protein
MACKGSVSLISRKTPTQEVLIIVEAIPKAEVTIGDILIVELLAVQDVILTVVIQQNFADDFAMIIG